VTSDGGAQPLPIIPAELQVRYSDKVGSGRDGWWEQWASETLGGNAKTLSLLGTLRCIPIVVVDAVL